MPVLNAPEEGHFVAHCTGVVFRVCSQASHWKKVHECMLDNFYSTDKHIHYEEETQQRASAQVSAKRIDV